MSVSFRNDGTLTRLMSTLQTEQAPVGNPGCDINFAALLVQRTEAFIQPRRTVGKVRSMNGCTIS